MEHWLGPRLGGGWAVMRGVVVIRAGLAGASAALRLGDAGKTVNVVEARGRLGDRRSPLGIGDVPKVMEFGSS